MSANARVAVLSVHTSPLDQPGIGDSGGMNVYIRAVAERLAARGVEVDVFTRDRGDEPRVSSPAPGVRVIALEAGPRASVPKADLPRFLPAFLDDLLSTAREEHRGYDVVHSHYWLSGWVGRAARRAWQVPLVASFHTLGKVKNYSLARGEAPEPDLRLAGEQAAIADADRILAPSPSEASQLVGLYRAEPGHLRIVPPGVDTSVFRPGDRTRARESLHLSGLRLAVYVGRLQPHKGPDIAVRAVAEAVTRDPETAGDLVLAIVGGPSGAEPEKGVEVARLMELASALGVAERVILFPPMPQTSLADVYAAADVVMMPSRSESFGLVALEAQACGTPVVAAGVGGLRSVVQDGKTGFLVEGHDPGDHADRLLRLLREPGLQAAMGREAARVAPRFTWDATTEAIHGVYEELLRPAPQA